MTSKVYIALWLIRSTVAVLCFMVTDKPASQPVMSFKYLESMDVTWKSRCNPCVYLLGLFSVHVCCAYACISVCCVLAKPSWCGGKGSHQGVFLSHVPFYFLRQSLLLNREPAISVRLAGQWASRIFLSLPGPSPMLRNVISHPACSHWF